MLSENLRFILRTPLPLYLWAHLSLQLPWLSPAFLGVSALVALLVGYLLGRSPLRLIFALGLVLALPWLVRGLFFLVFAVGRAAAPGPETDLLVLVFDRNYLPALLPFLYTSASALLFLRYPRFRFWDAAIHGLLLAALFWNQAFHDVTLYGSAPAAGVSIAAFVLVQALVLYLAGPGALSVRRPPFGPGAAPGSRRRVSAVLRRVGEAALVLAIAAVVVLLFFRRYGEDSVAEGGGGLMRSTLFQFDFSEYVDLESDISLDDDLVLLYRRDGSPARDLLRRFVLSGYESRRGFFRDDERPPEPLPPESVAQRERVEQDFFLVNLDSSAVLGLNEPVEYRLLENWEESSFSGMYRVDSLVPRVGTGALAALTAQEARSDLSPEFLDHYLRYGDDEAIRALALEAAGDTRGYYGTVKAVERFLKTNYYYSLRPGIALDGDQLKHFLFVSRKGYCSYFAFAMTLMLRSLGVPARVAVGFFAVPEFSIMNMYPIRSDMAHAWVEVYFGEYGWIEFDPTSSTPAPGENLPFSSSMDSSEIMGLLEEVLRAGAIAEVAPMDPESVAAGSGFMERLSSGVAAVARRWYLWIPAAYLAILLFSRLRFHLLGRRRGREAVPAAYRRLIVLLQLHGLSRHRDESVFEYAQRVDSGLDTLTGPLTSLYLATRFAPPLEATHDERLPEEARRTLRLARRSLRRLSLGRRLVALLRPVSLRGRR